MDATARTDGEVALWPLQIPAPTIAVTDTTDNGDVSPRSQRPPDLAPASHEASASSSPSRSSEQNGGNQPSTPSPEVSPSPSTVNGSTLVGFSEGTRTPSPSPSSTSPHPPLMRTWAQRWREQEFPVSTQTVMAIGVTVMTILGVVYAHRNDVLARYEALGTFYQNCANQNYLDPQHRCNGIKNQSLSLPPYADPSLVSHKAKRSIFGLRSDVKDSSQHTAQSPASFGLVCVLILVLTLIVTASVFGVYCLYALRRPRPSEYTPVKAEPPQSYTTGYERPSEGPKKRFFVPAVDAIKAAKRLTPSVSPSDSTVTLVEDDASSTRSTLYPEKRRASWMVKLSANPDSNEDFFMFRNGSTTHPDWKELNASEATLTLAKSNTHHSSEKGAEHHQHEDCKSKLLPSYCPDVGSTRPAVSYVGAIAAATVGGLIMQHCPLEVPKHKAGDMWMPMNPQDLAVKDLHNSSIIGGQAF